jgi:tetratricopeptide (TPR) repeat protein
LQANAKSGDSSGQILVRLNSWKEIARYFERDVRTVRRWEATRGLPVHRMPGGGRSGVFAYVAELEVWLGSSSGRETALEPAVAARGEESEEAEADAGPENEVGEVQAAVEAEAVRPAPLPHATTEQKRRSGSGVWVVAAAVLVLAAGAAGYLAHRRRVRVDVAASAEKTSKPPANGEAQELYLRGLYLWNQRTEQSLTQSVDLFTQAIVRDPHFAAAYAALADSYLLLRQYGHMADNEAFPRALAAAKQALALDDRSFEAHRSYAFVLNYWIWDFAAADAEFQRSIALKGDEAQTHSWYATTLYSAGKYQEAMREIDVARRLHPDSISILTNRGLLLAAVDRSAALAYLREVEKAAPAFPTLHLYLGNICLADGDYRCFLNERLTAATEQKDVSDVAVLNAAAKEFARSGSQGMLRLMAEKYGEGVDAGEPGAMQPASFYAQVGNWEVALHYLKVAEQRRESQFLAMNADPVYKPLYETAEYKALLVERNTPLDTRDGGVSGR